MVIESWIIETIIQQYFKEGEFTLLPLGKGHINTTCLLSLKDRQYVLQKVNTDVFRHPDELMKNIARTADILEQSDYPYQVLKPVQTLKGDHFIEVNKNIYRIFPFIENSIVRDTIDDPKQAYLAASAFGKFSKNLLSIDPASLYLSIPEFHDIMARFRVFESALQTGHKDRINECQVLISQIQSQRIYLGEIIEILNQCPLRIVHGDPKINNILFNEQVGLPQCIIDLDTVMPGPLLYDFSDMIRSYSNNYEEDYGDDKSIEASLPILREIVKGYLQELGTILTIEEMSSLSKGYGLVSYIQSLRFLTDYLLGDIYYKTQYPEHNLIRAKNQWALFSDLQNKESEIQEYISDYLPK